MCMEQAVNMMMQELREEPKAATPGRGVIAKVSYTHADMIDFIISNPGISQGAVAARYGYTEGWLSQVMSSDAFRNMMAERRGELVDPVLTATIEERFRGLANRSLDRLMDKLNAPVVSDQVVLKAVELGAKALGIGGNAAPQAVVPAGDHLAALANRLIALQSNIRQGVTINGQASQVAAGDQDVTDI